jgi:hypothetical protein
MKKPHNDRMLAKISIGVAIATIAGGALGAILGNHFFYIHANVSDPAVQRAVVAINTLSAGSTHVLKPFETTIDTITTVGAAVSRHAADGRQTCAVFVAADMKETSFSSEVKKATQWDDFSNSIYILGHELQHCETREDLEDIKTSTRGSHANLVRAVSPSDEMVHKLLSADNVELRTIVSDLRRNARAQNLNESVSDIVGLLLVQKLTPGGLPAEAVDGLIRVRRYNSRFDNVHNTTASLQWLATRLHLDPTYGRDLSIKEMAAEAYAIVSKANPYTTASIEQVTPTPSI